jgi:hypothetical protein
MRFFKYLDSKNIQIWKKKPRRHRNIGSGKKEKEHKRKEKGKKKRQYGPPNTLPGSPRALVGA